MEEALTPLDFTLKLPDGLRICGKRWGPLQSEKRILALHGWLDNAATWDALGPMLGDLGYLIVCIDFAGHGKSDHLQTALYSFETHILTIYQTLLVLGWSSCVILAHSMGGIVSLFFTGALRQMVQKIILVEALGPWARPGSKPSRLESEIIKYPKLLQITPRVYPTISSAVEKLMENNPNIDAKSASAIVVRSLLKVAGGFSFGHDPKLLGSNLRWYEEDEIQSYYERIECPILLFWTKKTLEQYDDTKIRISGSTEPQSLKSILLARTAYFKPNVLNTIVLEEGSHHVHLDRPDLVFPHVVKFLETPKL